MIEPTGLSARDDCDPKGAIEIEVVGLRLAGKLYEERLVSDNPKSTT